MNYLARFVGIIFAVLLSNVTFAAENLILITIDGLRWQEVFRGIDHELATNEEYSERAEDLLQQFWPEDKEKRPGVLMPFLHETVFRNGIVVGNRDRNSCARVINPWNFSYPGYSEILTGVVDPSIDTNKPIPNPNKTFMELLNTDSAFKGNMAAFTSWDVFSAIINEDRSRIYVNAYESAVSPDSFEAVLNQLQDDIPSPWKTVRLDAFTHHFALSYLKKHKPRVLYIAYGETDDFAHDGEYDQVIFSANRTDRFIREVWETVNSMEGYRGNTNLFITVDHGRGEDPIETWKHHASKESVKGYMQSLSQYEDGIVGSEAVWMAALGPDVPARGLVETADQCLTSNRIAATLLALLGKDYQQYNKNMGAPLPVFLP